MLSSYLTAIAVVVALMVLWVSVQIAWRKMFPDEVGRDEDVLAGRGGCGGCNHHGRCEDEDARAGKNIDPEKCDFHH